MIHESPSTPRSRRTRTGLTIAALALGGLLAVAGLGAAAVAFWDPLVASVAALQGQDVDTSSPDFMSPNLATTVSLSEGTHLASGAPTRMVATVENRGSGAVLATVTLVVPSTFSEPVVMAPESFNCKARTVTVPGVTSDHVVTCKGGTVRHGSPVTIAAEMHAPTESGTYVVGATSDLHLGFKDPDRRDNTACVVATVR